VEIVLAAGLDTLVDVITGLGLLTGICFIGIWAWVGIEELHRLLVRRRSWKQIEQTREDLAQDFAKDESIASFDFPLREHTTGRKSA
jgi:hypothetical protein